MKTYSIKKYEINHQSYHRLLISNLLLFLLFLSGCAHLFSSISYYDPTTYKNLTDLKPAVLFLYDSFTEDAINIDKFNDIRLKMAQMYEYEKGKGETNQETIEQLKIIIEMFDDHVNQRLKSGNWNNAHLANQKENISEAFDIAIKTERLKNKNE